jgi:RNA polymerase sigma-70 factor, ECF subfamily
MSKVVLQIRQRWTRERFERHTQHVLPALYRTARRLTRDPADAEDLVQDTYVKAFQAFHQADLQSEAACRAWLFRIMVNAYRDRYRRRQRSPEVQPFDAGGERDEHVIEMAMSTEPDPEVRLHQKLIAAAAQAAMEKLSPEVRLVVTLFLVEGFAYKDIAEIASCPIGTVMSRLARGRRQLQALLQAHRDGVSPEVAKARSVERHQARTRRG